MKKIIFKIKVWWFWLFTIRLYPSSPKWSKKLQYLIDEGFVFENINGYTATFGDELVWIANMPYASFRRCDKKITLHKSYDFIPNKEVGYKLVKLFELSLLRQQKLDVKKFEDTI